MNLETRLCLLFLISLLMSACANDSLKSPCNQYPTFCGNKTKINQW